MSTPNSALPGQRPSTGLPADGASSGEFAAIRRLASHLPPAPAGELWIGDDAAAVRLPRATAADPARLLLATDLVVAGVHGDLAVVGLDDLGWKAVARALSDIAAMGGDPGHALVAVAGPPDTDLDLLGRGVAEAAAAHGCAVVGGDLSTAVVVVVAVAVTGTVLEGPGPVTRGGAAPGDLLYVTGPLGAAAAGLRALRGEAPPAAPAPTVSGAAAAASALAAAGGTGAPAALVEAHRRPRARLAEGRAARLAGASAMIDVSDGLAADAGHLAAASGVGLALEDVPVAPGATEADALGGGEDYELVVATGDPEALEAAFARAGLRPPLAIGRCTADPQERTLRGGPLVASGWEHPFR